MSTINRNLSIGGSCLIRSMSDIHKIRTDGFELAELTAELVRPFLESNVTIKRIANIVLLVRKIAMAPTVLGEVPRDQIQSPEVVSRGGRIFRARNSFHNRRLRDSLPEASALDGPRN